ncbi:hypothetical protein K0U83_02410 [bacterium]|nr:hypothetical protein [bacterium]
MAAFNKFNSFITAVAAGTHAGFLNASTDVLNVYLSNATPSASADSVKADLAEIATGNGYTGPVDIQNAASQTGATITVTATDVTITASGSVGPFQYAVIYNDTAASDPLVGWYDYGSAVTLAAAETFKVDFGASLLTIG